MTDPCLATTLTTAVTQEITDLNKQLTEIFAIYKNQYDSSIDSFSNPKNSMWTSIKNEMSKLPTDLAGAVLTNTSLSSLMGLISNYLDPYNQYMQTEVLGGKAPVTAQVNLGFTYANTLFNMFEGLDLAFIGENSKIAIQLAYQEITNVRSLINQLRKLHQDIIAIDSGLASLVQKDTEAALTALTCAIKNITSVDKAMEATVVNSGVDMTSCEDTSALPSATFNPTTVNTYNRATYCINSAIKALTDIYDKAKAMGFKSEFAALQKIYMEYKGALATVDSIRLQHQELLLTLQGLANYAPLVTKPFESLYKSKWGRSIIEFLIELANSYFKFELSILTSIFNQMNQEEQSFLDSGADAESWVKHAVFNMPLEIKLVILVNEWMVELQGVLWLQVIAGKFLNLFAFTDKYSVDREKIKFTLCKLNSLLKMDWLISTIRSVAAIPAGMAGSIGSAKNYVSQAEEQAANLDDWLQKVIMDLEQVPSVYARKFESEMSEVKTMLTKAGLKSETLHRLSPVQLLTAVDTGSLIAGQLDCFTSSIRNWVGSDEGKMALSKIATILNDKKTGLNQQSTSTTSYAGQSMTDISSKIGSLKNLLAIIEKEI